jgi:ApaG protein
MKMTKHAITVSVQSQYVADQSSPADGHYLFAYTVTIFNSGAVPARLLTRHWIITDGNGKVQEVRGPGVVGEHPHLHPGEAFRYTSAAMLDTPVGSMHGSYQMVDDDGTAFDAPIPAFSLSIPNMLH